MIKDTAAQVGSFLGQNLPRLGRDDFFFGYSELRKQNPFLPEKPPLKYFVDKTIVKKVELVEDLESPGIFYAQINGDPGLKVPLNKQIENPSEAELADLIHSGVGLEKIFFTDEDVVAEIARAQNLLTIGKLDKATQYFGEAISGLIEINKTL